MKKSFGKGLFAYGLPFTSVLWWVPGIAFHSNFLCIIGGITLGVSIAALVFQHFFVIQEKESPYT